MLVCYDALGMYDAFKPKFVKQYAQVGEEIRRAAVAFCAEVREGAFPAAEHSYGSLREIAEGK